MIQRNVSIPYRKGKVETTDIRSTAQLKVSIPYRKGKDRLMKFIKIIKNFFVSIPYRKGKELNECIRQLKENVSIPYRKGKVGGGFFGYERHKNRSQFLIGKVKFY